ncbi:MAG TPA: hypothetical protein VFB39_17240 [Solirubrobacteraceae bacterium]|nr:hypothetical protein [Solirubrobacteraceae bacterium]
MSGRFRDATSRGRGPAAGMAVLAALAAALCAQTAVASPGSSISLKAKPAIVQYTKSASLTGTLSSGKKGALIKLEQRVWPFKGNFKTVSRTHTGAGGVFSFKRRPSLATEYRALAPGGHGSSQTRTVYVVKRFKVLRCVLTRPGHTYQGCGTTSAPPGHYTWNVTIEYLYPASVFDKEGGKPVYTYYGITVGSRKPPKTLERQRTVSQRAHGDSTTTFEFSHKVVVPKSAYQEEGNFCTKTSERKDGFGVPGAPGSHKCGAAKIPGDTSPNKLG